jgi:hypothetical protein
MGYINQAQHKSPSRAKKTFNYKARVRPLDHVLINVQNVHTPRHISSWTAASVKNAGVVSDSLTGIQSAMVRCLFVVNRSCIHKGIYVFPQTKIQVIQIWQAWRLCNGPSSTYPSVRIGVTDNISHSTARMCRSTITNVRHSCSDCQWCIFQ